MSKKKKSIEITENKLCLYQMFEKRLEKISDLCVNNPELWVHPDWDEHVIDEVGTVENAFRTCRELAEENMRLSVEVDLLRQQLGEY